MYKILKKKIQQTKFQQRTWTILLIVLISLLFRGIYFLQLNDSKALFEMHKWTQSDMHYYYEWASIIEEGDVLTNRPVYPYNFWQQQVANYAFENHPKQTQKLIGKNPKKLDEEARNRLLWEKWVGGKVFYADPFYAYWLAANFKIFGADVRWIFFWQMLLGVCSNVLIYLIAARYFGERVGIVAAAMAIFCAPLMYNELILIRATWITFTGLLLVYCLDKLLLQKHWKWWLLYGILLGVCMLLKSVYSLWLLYALGLVVVTYWRTPKQVIKFGLLLIVGMYIGRAPLVARNLAVGLEANPSSGYGAISFILTNYNGYNGKTNAVDIEKSVDLMIASNLQMLPAIQKTLQTHENPQSYLKLLWQKFEVTWNGFEASDNANFYYYRLHAPILQFLFFSFYWIAPLSIVGFFLALFHQKQFWKPIYAFAILQVVLLAVFFILSRLRLPLVAIMVPFAAYALVYLFENRNKTSLGILMVVALLAFWVNRPMHSSKIRYADYAIPYHIYYKEVLRKVEFQNRPAKGLEIMESFLEYQPENVAQLKDEESTSKLKIDKQTASFYSNVYMVYAGFQRSNGNIVEAEILKAKSNLLKRIGNPKGN